MCCGCCFPEHNLVSAIISVVLDLSDQRSREALLARNLFREERCTYRDRCCSGATALPRSHFTAKGHDYQGGAL